MNHVFLIGNLTRDPELRATTSGKAVCNFGIAVNRRFANQQGEREVDFFNIVAWGAQGENCAKYLKKGNKVGVAGSIQVRNYDGKDGTKRTAVDINADEVQFLSSPNQSGIAPQAGNAVVGAGEQEATFTPVDDEELPF